ncbi:NAD(P)-binding domain-containing protein [Mycoplasmopsis agassizii]|uniref:NAD(P)-binding domain-containing protein n=1 Tax=Mycoplasmopsis agassizii TaxID=33922 RepID=UPI003527DC3A
MNNIAIIGFRELGQAFAKHLSDKKELNIKAFTLSDKTVSQFKNHRFSEFFNEDLEIANLLVSNNLKDVVHDADIVISTISRKNMRDFFPKVFEYMKDNAVFITTYNGNFPESKVNVQHHLRDLLEYENTEHKLNKNIEIMALSGMYRASSLYKGDIQFSSLVSENVEVAKSVRSIIGKKNFRVYINTDIKGSEVFTNFLQLSQLAVGMLDAMGFDECLTAAFVTRLAKEVQRFNHAYGGRMETFTSLSSLPNILLFTFSKTSDNFLIAQEVIKKGKRVLSIAKIRSPFDALIFFKHFNDTVYKLHMPIIDTMFDLLHRDLTPKEAVEKFVKSEINLEDEN